MEREGVLDFVVGEDKALSDILCAAEVAPLLQALADGTGCPVRIEDTCGRVLWERGHANRPEASETGSFPIDLEGEEVARVVVAFSPGGAGAVQGQAMLVARAVTGMAAAGLKRMLTTETHVHVVEQAHRDLLDAFRRLEASERGYRELAGTLEIKVRERTEELGVAMTRLLQKETMASIGQLAAGVAHEINNPMGFVASNIATLGRYAERFRQLFDAVGECLDRGALPPGDADALREQIRRLRMEEIFRDLPDLVGQTLEGAERVQRIVSDLRGFSHVDGTSCEEIRIDEEVERTLRVLSPEVPDGAVVDREGGPVRAVFGHPGPVAVAILHLVRNAFQSRREGLRVRIRTWADGEDVVLEVADNGPGIPAEILPKIFEPFFTTKEVGAGKGLGLSVVYEIARAAGGGVEAESPAEGGAVFRLRLPHGGNDCVEVR
jgi:two-component system, NtrC family, sensor kinase